MMMSFQPFQLVVQASGETTLITAGMPGPAGANGLGVPTGGTTGQALVKNSNANNDTTWQTVATVGVIIQDSATQTGSTWSSSKIQTQLDTKASSTHNHNTLYATLASAVPIGGTTGQVLTKNSATDYDDSWQTLINASAEFDLTGVSWNSGTPPATTGSLRGRFVTMGALVALSVRLEYEGATAVSNISCSIPMDGQFPLALEFAGVNAANEVIVPGIGIISTSEAATTSTNSSFVCIRRNPNNNGQEIFIRSSATAALKFASAMLLYRKA
ncbi:MAG: hypothetical protein H2174_04425 [Vampirovibrio sp.]|nr:hypothetical protein [Vampirovibrio sp.]